MRGLGALALAGAYIKQFTACSLQALSPTVTDSSMPALSLRSLAQRRRMHIGAAVAARPLREEAVYAQTLGRELSMLTPESAMKFGVLHPRRDRYDFDDADAIVNFAIANAMRVHGHTLVWHEQVPPWLVGVEYTRDELIEILREHIWTVVGRFRGRVATWDVVNEAIIGDGSLRDTIWFRGIGPEYIDLVFRWAHEADSQARLFYNDYGGEVLNRKSDAIYNLVQGLQERGAPIHGVGLQMHLALESPPDLEAFAANMNRLAELDLAVHVSEMDIRIREPITEEKLAAQAQVYRDILGACLAAKNCEAFVLWGFTDLYSWIPTAYPGTGAALIFDESYRPKPAYNALRDLLMGG